MTHELTDAEVQRLEREPVNRATIQAALDGGYVAATVRSKATGRHIAFTLACKRRRDGRTLPRTTIEGRVGFADCDVLYIDADGQFVARLERADASWRVARDADANVVWAAKAILRWASEPEYHLDAQADVMLRAACAVCHRGLKHPESIAERIGPECSGRRRKGRRAERVAVA